MKGVVFTEFLEMVEATFGDDVLDEIVENSNLPSGGAYTAVGTYDYRELVMLVQALSTETGVEIPVLIKAFGKHTFSFFVKGYPSFFVGADDAFDFLMNVEDYIHVEVRKLYPDAELPSFDGEILDTGHMRLTYSSPRPFADLAEGLIEGCGEYFNQPIEIERREAKNGGNNSVEFFLTCPTREGKCTT